MKATMFLGLVAILLASCSEAADPQPQSGCAFAPIPVKAGHNLIQPPCSSRAKAALPIYRGAPVKTI